jgi:hypothetical protein
MSSKSNPKPASNRRTPPVQRAIRAKPAAAKAAPRPSPALRGTGPATVLVKRAPTRNAPRPSAAKPKKKKKGGALSSVTKTIGKVVDAAQKLVPMFLPFFASPAHAMKCAPRQGVLTMANVKTSASAGLAYGASLNFDDLMKKRRMSSRMDPVYGEVMCIAGMDFLTSVATPSTTIATGLVLNKIDVNPSNWQGTRLGEFADLYEMWRLKRMIFIYEPACPATTPGAVTVYVDPDPDDNAEVDEDVTLPRLLTSALSAHLRPDQLLGDGVRQVPATR